MKIKLCVLFGGKSVEHEVSVISAMQAISAINTEKYEVIPVYITKNSEFYTGADCSCIEAYRDIPALLKKSIRCTFMNIGGRVKLLRYPFKRFGNNVLTDIDIAFPIVHGTNVEDGGLQGFLKTLGLPFVGCDVAASAVGMNKYIMKAVLKDNGVPTLDCLRFNSFDYDEPERIISACREEIGYPVIVKPVNLGSSVGISVAHTDKELKTALDDAFGFSSQALVERAVTNLKEINCSVLGDSQSAAASECEQPAKTEEILSYKDKYASEGGKKSGGSKGMAGLARKIPADITSERREEIRALAVKAFKALGCCGVSRIDFIIDEDIDKVYLNEINTIPGSLSFYLWEPLGVSYTELLDHVIELSLKRRREEEALIFSFDTNILSLDRSFDKGTKSGKCGEKKYTRK